MTEKNLNSKRMETKNNPEKENNDFEQKIKSIFNDINEIDLINQEDIEKDDAKKIIWGDSEKMKAITIKVGDSGNNLFDKLRLLVWEQTPTDTEVRPEKSSYTGVVGRVKNIDGELEEGMLYLEEEGWEQNLKNVLMDF